MSLYRSGRTANVQIRSLTSSSRLGVGPESPNYIEIPRTLQPNLPSETRVKGTLPVPREIFPARRLDKPSEAYITAATPLPVKKEPVPKDDPNIKSNAWKRRMAEKRRQNLSEGLLELHDRKQRADRWMTELSMQKQARRERISHQRPREDEWLTGASIVQAMQPVRTPVLPDPDREERLARSRALVQAKEAEKRAERRDALHTLYMNSRNFITTEKQLEAEIQRVFPDRDNPAWRNDQQSGENIWNLGVPPTIQTIVNDRRRTEPARWEMIQGRVKKLVEEITGGKI
ncbi:hypothetical protein V8E54_010122 [Elaphomyces granulatus]